MKKDANKNKCWACGVQIGDAFSEPKAIPSCKPNHYKLFLKSFSGETIEDLLKRLPEAQKYL